MNDEKQFPQKLLVEGNDDLHVVFSLCVRFKVPETFNIVDSKSIEKLLESVSVRVKEPDITTIGFVLDADRDINARWQQIRNKLVQQEIQIPASLPADGLVFQAESKRIGIWIMPNNETTGMLEDFAAFLIPEGDLLKARAETTLNEIEGEGINGYQTPLHRSKALIHTWLAWQEDPGTPMGLAITKKYLDANSEHAQRFVNWLNRLFNPETTAQSPPQSTAI